MWKKFYYFRMYWKEVIFMSVGYKKLVEMKYALDCIAKYFHYLRKVKRGELKDVPKHYKTFDDGELMKKLIQENLLIDKHKCNECNRLYTKIEDYYNHLPLIFISNGNGITLVCNNEKCRKSAIKKLIKINKKDW